MASGRSPEVEEKVNTQKGSATFLEGNRNKSKNSIEPFVARGDHNATDLRSWAKRTGFVSYFSSGEVVRSSGTEKDEKNGFDLEKKPGSSSPKIEIDPILGRTRNRIPELEPNLRHGGRTRNSENEVQPIVGGKDEEERRNELIINGKGVSASNVTTDTQVMERKKENGNVEREEIGIDMHLDGGCEEPSNGGGNQSLRLKCGLRENPGFVPLIYYGMQHYFSLAGSLIFIPLIIIPAMGGIDRDTATVISTIMLVTGVATILHSYFGTQLPLVQGNSFMYLGPALVIMNA